MSPSKEQELQVDSYLRKLRECLPNMSVADREEIVREISVHIRECAQESNSSIDGILRRLGSAEGLASQYGHDLLIRHASRSISPVLIVRATLELAKRSIEGFVLFLGALIGYSLGGGLVVTAALKPIFPRQVGLWIGPGVFNFGFHEPIYSDPVHEVLGWWYVPVAFCLGCFFLWLTTHGIRWFLRRSRQRGPLFAYSPVKPIIPIILFCLLAARPSLSLLPNNQAKHRDHTAVFALDEGQRNAKHHSATGGTSACSADAHQQFIDIAKVADAVRESVRLSKGSEHAN